MKIIIVPFFLFSFVIFVSCNERYRDDEMLRSHHHHKHFLLQSSRLRKAPPINVHLIPHTHDDVGWIRTADEYFWGVRLRVEKMQGPGQVQYILDTVIMALEQDPKRKFVYVEIYFFMKWWNLQTAEKKLKVQRLVKNGQLEFINGGICMNDEGTTHFEDIIDQLTLGHRFLKDVFNVTVNIGWHLDPFGHSSAQANIFAEMGFDAFYFSRVDYQDKNKRMEEKDLEMIWKPKGSEDNQGIFSAITYYHYNSPPDFCFDETCDDEPLIDDEGSPLHNIDKRALELVQYFKNMALHYKQKELMHVVGQDFQFANAFKYFINIERMISYLDNHPELGVKLFYSTPSAYIKEINKLNVHYEEKNDDFMPYADMANNYWTGYFTSRPKLKKMVKESGRFLQTVRTLFALSQFSPASQEVDEMRREMMISTYDLERAMAILQHHDAVAGTAVQYVTNDYISTLSKGVSSATQVKKTS